MLHVRKTSIWEVLDFVFNPLTFGGNADLNKPAAESCKFVKYFRRKASSQMFDRVLNTRLGLFLQKRWQSGKNT